MRAVCEDDMQHTHILWKQNAELYSARAVVHIVTNELKRLNILVLYSVQYDRSCKRLRGTDTAVIKRRQSYELNHVERSSYACSSRTNDEYDSEQTHDTAMSGNIIKNTVAKAYVYQKLRLVTNSMFLSSICHG